MSEIRKLAPREIIPEAKSERVKLSLTKAENSLENSLFLFLLPSSKISPGCSNPGDRLPLPRLGSRRIDRNFTRRASRKRDQEISNRAKRPRAPGLSIPTIFNFTQPARKYKWKGNGTAACPVFSQVFSFPRESVVPSVVPTFVDVPAFFVFFPILSPLGSKFFTLFLIVSLN